MGRKIPGRKHRGVRDPEKQRAVRMSGLKGKINAPPTDPDDQYVPKSLTRIMELKEKCKNMPAKLKRKKKSAEDRRKLPGNYTQNPGESDYHLMRRVQMNVNEKLKEAAFENKYNVNVKRNKDTGEVESVVKRGKDQLVEMIKKAKKDEKDKSKKKKKKKKEGEDQPRLTKSQKRQKKLTERKQRLLANKVDEFKTYEDSVAFGETVHAPPTLPVPRKVKSLKEAPRPGRKDLLLKSAFTPQGNFGAKPGNSVFKSDKLDKSIKPNGQPNKQSGKGAGKNKEKTLHKVIDKKGKRKDLPNAMRRQLDKQQREVIEAYKLIKSKKGENH